MDSIPVQELKDSLRMYMVKGKINREQMNRTGQLYDCVLGNIPNKKFMINLLRTYPYKRLRVLCRYGELHTGNRQP